MTDYRQFACPQCGAQVAFDPQAGKLKCGSCGHVQDLPAAAEPVRELDFRETLRQAEAAAETETHETFKCQNCGAEMTPDPNLSARCCSFCGSPIVAAGGSMRRIKPRSLLPFHVTREQARDAFRAWVRRLWFAPSALAALARVDSPISGMYVPYWTYDSQTDSDYRGERGDDFWETEHYTAFENGKSVSKTRQVRRTRWHSVSGAVQLNFDDVLIRASRSLPAKQMDRLEPWDLPNLVPYEDAYLTGFGAETYQVDLAQGFDQAAQIMDVRILRAIERDIGGDHQRIHAVNTRYGAITFKHLLLPVWVSAYRYADTTYRFVVNARTAEVQGERPYSWIKITLAALAGSAVIAAIVMAIMQHAGRLH